MKKVSNDLLLGQALGELTQTNKQMSVTLESIRDNLKTLNDYNVLHAQSSSRLEEGHKAIIEQGKSLQKDHEQMQKRYWWLIVGLIAIVLFVLGYKEVLKILTPVG